MKRINLTILFIALALVLPKHAFASNVSITQLPGYINYTDFKLSCSALGGSTAQFSSKKDGGSYSDFGSVINLATTPCQVQVSGSQFGSEGKFFFKVTLNDGTSAETSVTLDTSSTGNVSDFGKDRLNSGTTYRVHWKNPLESDFQKVYMYRGTEPGFNADDSHKVAEIGGNPGDTQSWEDGGLDTQKEYYYVIRALDRASNSSGLVGDAGTITQTTSLANGSQPARSGSVVTQLPGEGSVLGDEVDSSNPPQAASTVVAKNVSISGLYNWIVTHKKISLGILILIGGLVILFRRFKNK